MRADLGAVGGLIPAHAGKTGCRRSAPWRRRAHPRSRGENACSHPARPASTGSSPLTRGKPRKGRVRPHGIGLIPAHAGKTLYVDVVPSMKGAHPRSRGENKWLMIETRNALGSSPLTRGKQQESLMGLDRGRLIPAHAGKTAPAGERSRGEWAHPRSRGENRLRTEETVRPSGSSPLTRGKQSKRDTGAPQPGLIPAHAGKTRRQTAWLRSSAAHPRSRGENANFLGGVVSSPGSSPLTRGKPSASQADWRERGLIPAHAGKTKGAIPHGGERRAHPRSRGENWLA